VHRSHDEARLLRTSKDFICVSLFSKYLVGSTSLSSSPPNLAVTSFLGRAALAASLAALAAAASSAFLAFFRAFLETSALSAIASKG